jgi:hypothetical protein
MIEDLNIKVDLDELERLFNEAWEIKPWSITYPTVQSGLSVSAPESEDFMEACQKWLEPARESQLNYLAACYQSTYLEKLIDSLPLKTCRWRWMVMFGKSCYSMHYDNSERIHVPLISNDQSFLLFKDPVRLYQMTPGHTYRVNTTKVHTAMNCKDTWRVHLVGCIQL